METVEPRLYKGDRIYAIFYENGKRRQKHYPANYPLSPEEWFRLEFLAQLGFYEAVEIILNTDYQDTSKGTYNSYKAAIKNAREFLPGGEWKVTLIKPFCTWLQKKEISTSSIQQNLGALSGLCKKACLMGYLTENPFQYKPKLTPNEPTRFRPLTTDQANELIEFLKKENDFEAVQLCELVRYTLIRPGELALLTNANVDVKSRLITVPASVSKTNRKRQSVIPTALTVKQNIEPNDANNLFLNDLHETRKRIHCAMNALGFPADCSLYSLKHTGAVELLNRTNNLMLVKRQAGHESVKSTEKYLRDSETVEFIARVG